MSIFDSVEALISTAKSMGLPLWKAVQVCSADEANMSCETSWSMMAHRLDAMKKADASYDPNVTSRSGLVGGDAEKLRRAIDADATISGPFIGEILAGAVRMGECNACMHRIVAAPTAGACGVIPAVLLPYAKKFGVSDDELIKSLYVASGFGAVIATRASMAGAEAGCQAEIGSAASMAGAALVYLHGGDEQMMANAAAIALKNLLGLVCDPVAGLVEVPCVKRNVIGAMSALSAAELALAGVTSRIPADEVFDAMRSVGLLMPQSLRETGEGGVAASPTAQSFRKRFANT